jgi:predicted ATPase
VGENGLGQSTVLEAIAYLAGFSDAGGAQDIRAVEQSAISGVDAVIWALAHHAEETFHFRIYREFAPYPHETVEAMIL